MDLELISGRGDDHFRCAFASFYAHGKGDLTPYHAEGAAVHRPAVLEGGLGGKGCACLSGASVWRDTASVRRHSGSPVAWTDIIQARFRRFPLDRLRIFQLVFSRGMMRGIGSPNHGHQQAAVESQGSYPRSRKPPKGILWC